MKKILCFVILAITIGCQRVPEESCMAIDMNRSAYINYGSIVNNQTIRTISFFINADNFTDYDNFVVLHSGQGWYLLITTAGKITFAQSFPSGTPSQSSWSGAAILSAETTYHIVLSYDGSNILNDPILYINGVTSPIANDTRTDSGTMGDDSDGVLYVGGLGSSPYYSLDGQLQDVRIYNRILSASEVSELYNSRCQRVVMDGLVFWAPMDGAAGLSSFDGATLSSANTIIDRISGVQGIPSGSPIGRGNTIQRIY